MCIFRIGRHEIDVEDITNFTVKSVSKRAKLVTKHKTFESIHQDLGLVVCGLDSVVARRWMNSMLVSLYVDPPNKQIPLIDGGTEGFKGNARIIIPGKSACIECTLNLYPPQVNFPLCTIAQTPRLPEHCIEYVRMMQWPAETPFGKDIDGDNPEHIQWIFEKALERGSQYGISGITYRLTQGVVKNIIPAVASTNAVIAAACATEVFKLVSGCAPIMNNYMVFNDADGIYAYTYEQEKKKDCMACSLESQIITLREESTLRELIDYLIESPVYQMRSPGVTMVTAEGRNKTLYMKTLREHTEANLSKSLKDLGVREGTEVNVTDVTSLLPCILKIYFDSPMTS
ncbi:NEDD8-activating enzyme E1 catalytic subunit-like isoform X2 [Artemia franciscana]|uniref:NEDD8-activating enzyme E1 catalytic subunit-like isoform X2 n=1 Tax=Artemia franciscana TaxID=6661 RepID=UPI0032DAC460